MLCNCVSLSLIPLRALLRERGEKGGELWRKIEKQKEAVSACRFAGFTLTISKAFLPVHLSRAKAPQPYVSNHSKDILLVCFRSRATERQPR